MKKPLTAAERIASVDYELRERIIQANLSGRGMKHLATDYGISEGTIRAIIHDSKLSDRPPAAKRMDLNAARDLWNNPRLWKLYGLKRPESYRMV